MPPLAIRSRISYCPKRSALGAAGAGPAPACGPGRFVRRPESVSERRRSTSSLVEERAAAGLVDGAAVLGRTPESVSRRRFSTSSSVARAARAARAGPGASRANSSRTSEKMSEEVRPRAAGASEGAARFVMSLAAIAAVADSRRVSSEKGRDRRSNAPTRCASAFEFEPLYPETIRRIGGAVAPPRRRISRITSALGSLGSIPDRRTRSKRVEENVFKASSPSCAATIS